MFWMRKMKQQKSGKSIGQPYFMCDVWLIHLSAEWEIYSHLRISKMQSAQNIYEILGITGFYKWRSVTFRNETTKSVQFANLFPFMSGFIWPLWMFIIIFFRQPNNNSYVIEWNHIFFLVIKAIRRKCSLLAFNLFLFKNSNNKSLVEPVYLEYTIEQKKLLILINSVALRLIW